MADLEKCDNQVTEEALGEVAGGATTAMIYCPNCGGETAVTFQAFTAQRKCVKCGHVLTKAEIQAASV